MKNVTLISEDYTSKECSLCGVVHEKGRVFRGLYICSTTGVKVNADLNVSLNIGRRVGYVIRLEKVLSYFVFHGGVFSITLLRGNARDPCSEDLALQSEKEIIAHCSLKKK